MLPAGFEPKISTGERPQTYALDRAATGTSVDNIYHVKKKEIMCTEYQANALVKSSFLITSVDTTFLSCVTLSSN